MIQPCKTVITHSYTKPSMACNVQDTRKNSRLQIQ